MTKGDFFSLRVVWFYFTGASDQPERKRERESIKRSYWQRIWPHASEYDSRIMKTLLGKASLALEVHSLMYKNLHTLFVSYQFRRRID
jgi:hypothetical protein